MQTETLTNSDWIALSAAVVALCALAATIWQGYLTRLHSRLSVMPHLEIVIFASDTDVNRVAIKNGGLGPAILEYLEFSIEGKKFIIRANSDYDPIFDELSKSVEKLRVTCFTPDSHSIIAPTESWLVLEVSSHEQKLEMRNSFKALFDKVRVKVRYRCLYGVKYSCEYLPHIAA